MQSEQNKQLIDDLIIGYLGGELNAAQINELIIWIKQDKSNKRYFDEISEIWVTSNAVSGKSGYHPMKGFANFEQTIGKALDQKSSWYLNRFQTWLRIAAIFIIAFFLGSLIFFNIGKSKGVMSNQSAFEIIVPRGAKAHFIMSDGTKVTLNAGSKLRYYSNYGVKDRMLQLEGEGYFKVAKDKSRPFIVTTSHVNVKALGTEFNVKAYPSDKTIETTLVEGSVRIENRFANSGTEDIILKPNQKLTFYKDEAAYRQRASLSDINKDKFSQSVKNQKLSAIHRLVAENVNVQPVISWKENRWIIEKQALSQLAIDLERKFDIDIQFDSERLKKFRFTGTLMDESLEQVLNVMTCTAPINYKIKGKNVVFTEKIGFEDIYMKLYKDNNQ
jgi:transmembrane sensor